MKWGEHNMGGSGGCTLPAFLYPRGCMAKHCISQTAPQLESHMWHGVPQAEVLVQNL